VSPPARNPSPAAPLRADTKVVLNPALAVAAIAAGYFVPKLLGGSPTVYNTLVVIAIFSVMAYGVDVILSYLGEVSLGHTIFWASGAYVAGKLSTTLPWNGWFTLLAAVAFAVVLALALGLLTLRTREFVFSLVTYAAAVVALNIAHNWNFIGGSDGIVGIPLLDLSLPGVELVAGSNQELWPYSYTMLVVVILFIHRFRRSRLGAAALMVHMNPDLAATLGVDTRQIRVMVFVLSAPVTAMAGWLYAYQRAYVGPDLFEAFFLLIMLTAVVITGRRILLGPLIGTSIVITQQNFFSIGGDGDKVVLGLVLILVLVFWPKGLVGVWQSLRRRRA
jgi:branched-chain amino acid transport system permease protein